LKLPTEIRAILNEDLMAQVHIKLPDGTGWVFDPQAAMSTARGCVNAAGAARAMAAFVRYLMDDVGLREQETIFNEARRFCKYVADQIAHRCNVCGGDQISTRKGESWHCPSCETFPDVT
jgi:lipopolysaccharide biosynthesis regulator YciM